ncbi:MAG: hypothetical protein WAU34_14365, partial [Desulfobacterales bacterium]
MKKIAWTIFVAIALFLVVPLPSDAGQYRGYNVKNFKAGYYGRGGYHRTWGGPRAYWGPRAYRGPRAYWGPRTSFGFYWGGPLVVGPQWYPYGYYSPPPVIVQQQPPVVVQPEQQSNNYWYYCQNPQGYYPYVKSCPGGW